MNHDRPRARAFTMVEMLVVIGILALLLGTLLPALSGAQKRSRKHKELNSIRQVGLAWTLYANGNNDKVLPGWLDPDVQKKWRVAYEYPNHQDIEPALAGPWTWRLLPYLENNHEIVHGYADEPEFDSVTLGSDPEEAERIANNPGFGYNAYYVGGWWQMNGGFARPVFSDATVGGVNVNVVSRSIGSIRRSTELLIFCSSSELDPGLYRSFRDDQLGSHYVTPPRLGTARQWTSAGGGGGTPNNPGATMMQSGPNTELEAGGMDPTTLKVETRTSAPIGRYNRLVAVLYADDHVGTATPGTLTDMRLWIDSADDGHFTHD